MSLALTAAMLAAPCSHPIINNVLGGSGGQLNNADLPQTMQIDYVQAIDTTGNNPSSDTSGSDTSGDTAGARIQRCTDRTRHRQPDQRPGRQRPRAHQRHQRRRELTWPV